MNLLTKDPCVRWGLLPSARTTHRSPTDVTVCVPGTSSRPPGRTGQTTVVLRVLRWVVDYTVTFSCKGIRGVLTFDVFSQHRLNLNPSPPPKARVDSGRTKTRGPDVGREEAPNPSRPVTPGVCRSLGGGWFGAEEGVGEGEGTGGPDRRSYSEESPGTPEPRPRGGPSLHWKV